jgi:hypothetical protein
LRKYAFLGWIFAAGLLTAQKPARQPLDGIELNHFYFVPDAATYRAIAGSDFLRRQFAVAEERTTVRDDSTYTGFYLYGENTYFEFLKPDARYAEGAFGLALGSDESGTWRRLAPRWKEAGVSGEPVPITRQLRGQNIPWFQMIAGPGDAPGVQVFFLEYLPQFLQNWHAGRDPRAGGIRRQDILARYAAVLQAAPMERLLQDVHAVEVCLTGAEERALLSGARLLGAGTRILSDGSSVTAGRFHLRIRRENSPGQRGRRMALRLRGKPPRQTLILGSSRLEILENGTAAWTFGPAARR